MAFCVLKDERKSRGALRLGVGDVASASFSRTALDSALFENLHVTRSSARPTT